MIQRESIHKYEMPSLNVITTASRNVCGRSARENPPLSSLKFSFVNLMKSAVPHRWLKVMYDPDGVVSLVSINWMSGLSFKFWIYRRRARRIWSWFYLMSYLLYYRCMKQMPGRGDFDYRSKRVWKLELQDMNRIPTWPPRYTWHGMIT